jgi:hypothetical protein
VTAPEAVFAAMQERGQSLVHRMGVKYSIDRHSPFTSPEDFEQEVWTRLWEWLDDPAHVEQAIALLEDTTETQRWITQFSRGRCCDLIDVALAGTRDQRLTVTASIPLSDQPGSGYDNTGITLLEYLSHRHGLTCSDPGSDSEALESLRAEVGRDFDAQQILTAILEQPPALRESFCESRLRLCRGLATLTEGNGPTSLSTIRLSTLEGYNIEDQEVTFDGRLPGHGRLATDQGEAVVSTPEAGQTVIRWTGTKLTVHLDRNSHEGEFIREVIRPSPRIFDLQAMRDYLGISGLRIREAWLRLQPILRAKLGAA